MIGKHAWKGTISALSPRLTIRNGVTPINAIPRTFDSIPCRVPILPSITFRRVSASSFDQDKSRREDDLDIGDASSVRSGAGARISVEDGGEGATERYHEEEGSTSDSKSPDRPKLPGSIKKLNRILGRQTLSEIPEHELKEQFVRGSGPGGQAINKTSSSVSLIHLPTGLRVQAQPTRSREQNRKAARRILAEKLDMMIATGAWSRETPSASSTTQSDRENRIANTTLPEKPKKPSRKELRKTEELELAGKWSRQEIQWEKERRRKANRAKKSKRKKREAVDGRDGDVESDEGEFPDEGSGDSKH